MTSPSRRPSRYRSRAIYGCSANNRLLCGDSALASDVKRVLGSVRPHLMVTDPPYGVDYEPNWQNEAARAGSLVHTIGATAVGKVQNDGRVDWREAWSLFPGEAAYVWHAGIHAQRVAESLESAGFAIRSQIIWNKDRLIIGRGNYHWKHEPCWYAVRQKGKGDRSWSCRASPPAWTGPSRRHLGDVTWDASAAACS